MEEVEKKISDGRILSLIEGFIKPRFYSDAPKKCLSMLKGDSAMKSKKCSVSNQKPLQPQKPGISELSGKLTPSEIEQLRQNKKDANAYFQEAFKHLKKK
jgi:hypothetical protein